MKVGVPPASRSSVAARCDVSAPGTNQSPPDYEPVSDAVDPACTETEFGALETAALSPWSVSAFSGTETGNAQLVGAKCPARRTIRARGQTVGVVEKWVVEPSGIEPLTS